MRVAYFLNSFPNLSETFINAELVELLGRGVSVRVYALREGDERQPVGPLRDLVADTLYVDPRSFGQARKLWHHLRLVLRRPRAYRQAARLADQLASPQHRWEFRNAAVLANWVRHDRITHIHAHYASDACAYALWVAQLTGLPLTFTTHGFDLFFQPPDHMATLARQAAAVIAVSRFNRRYLIEHFGVEPAKIEVIHCGVDPNRFSPGPDDYRDPRRVLTVARLHPVKGLAHLVDAYGLLHRQGVPFVAHIVGEGPQRAALQEQIHTLGLDSHVTLLGARRGDELVDCYRRAALCVLPSLSESMGLVNMEALACQTPVIATRVRGVPELIEDGVTGRLVAPADPPALADAIAQLLADPAQRARLGRAGRQKVLAHFTLAGQVDRLLACWQRVAWPAASGAAAHRPAPEREAVHV